jgi:hypothetical protein
MQSLEDAIAQLTVRDLPCALDTLLRFLLFGTGGGSESVAPSQSESVRVSPS